MKPDAMPGSGTPRFIVIGAGVGGICSALDLAEAGHPVTLVEQGPSTGGILPQLDHQFPDDHCGMCRMLPMVDRDGGEQTCLKRGLFHENIRILTGTKLTDLKGRPGDYTAQLTRTSRGIDSRRCSGCMACLDACPVEVPDAFNDRVGRRKAVYRPLFGNPEGLPAIDWESCTRCGACLAACPNQAVDLEPTEVRLSLAPVAGVILAGGNRLYDAAVTDLYGYGVLPNVVTATAFERILSGTGPYGGRPVRPFDGKPIHRVGWIQCVGSRNVMIGSGHCSSACCMIAVKEAILAKRILGPHIDAAIFHMDMRTYGRDDQRYRDRAEEQAGVRFIRCRIHSVDAAGDPGDVNLTYLDTQNRVCVEVFDLVVLSTGAAVQPNPAPFLAEPAYQGAVAAVGPEAGLQNIRETVVRAHGAVGSLLAKTSQARYAPGADPAKGTTRRAEDRFKERPLIQILLLENVAVKKPEVDWPEIRSQLEAWAFPLPVERLSILEERDPWLDLAALLESSAANRLLIVSTVVGGYREALSQRIAEAAFSAPLVEWVDLNCAGSPFGKGAISTAFALAMIRAAWMRLLHKRPLRGVAQAVEQRALVVGAGPSGLSAALSLAEQGVSVEVVEKKSEIGGNGPSVQEEETRRAVEALMAKAKGHPLIAIHTETTLGALSGRPGRFEGRLVTGDRQHATAFGAAIIATGGTSAATDAYGLGRHPRVVSHFDFEKRTLEPRFAEDPLETVVMIQCAGSREEPRNYCSRTCCVKSLQTALRVRRMFPQARIVIFYRDIMTPGLNEALYAQARSNGIRFIPFEKQAPPEVRTEEDRVIVHGFDPVMGEAVCLEADWVSLAVGVAPSPVSELCRILSVPLTPDGFVEEADPKWRPVDTINPGIFVCGLARGPLPVQEAVLEGRAAALRALRLLKREALIPQRGAAVVRDALCSRCYLCLDACPYGARYVETVSGKVAVDPAACQGCGSCASVCPNSATVIADSEDFTVMSVIETALG
jgi:heterodisulfide reductase subunit A2